MTAAAARARDPFDRSPYAVPACRHCYGTGEIRGNPFTRCSGCHRRRVNPKKKTCSRCFSSTFERHLPVSSCHCTYRYAFRSVLRAYHRFGDCTVTHGGSGLHRVNQIRVETRYIKHEFRADVVISAKRILDPTHLRVFRRYHLEQLAWRRAAPRCGLSRGQFFHAVYRVEEQLGQRFRELKPYALFPVNHYRSTSNYED